MKSNRASKDIISCMPENVITNILDRLPVQDAMRTSILARNWRFSWTLLTQLVFDEEFVMHLPSKNGRFFQRKLSNILLQLKGPISKFHLYIPSGNAKRKYKLMYEDIINNIGYWILLLSTKGIQELDFYSEDSEEPMELPDHISSCLELKHLKLRNCCLSSVNGFQYCFPNLSSFDFYDETSEGCNFGELVNWCPLLENLIIDYKNKNEDNEPQVEFDEIAKLVNLKKLSLPLCKLGLGNIEFTSSNIFEIIEFLPRLEELTLDFWECWHSVRSGGSERLSTTSPNLKTLVLKGLRFDNKIMVECACDLIKGIPNLQNLEINDTCLSSGGHSPPECLEITGDLRLRRVNLKYICDFETEVCFIKWLLASSSLLQDMVIYPYKYGGYKYGGYEFARKLLRLHRASPVADIQLVKL